MEPGERDHFAAEAAALEALLSRERDVAVARLRALHEAWARALLALDAEAELAGSVRERVERGIDPALAREAAEHLAVAEQWQWEIGTWATGSGEGLASMFRVRTLQIARAWLLGAAASEPAELRAARELAEEAGADPNRVAARLQKHVAALVVWIGDRSDPTGGAR